MSLLLKWIGLMYSVVVIVVWMAFVVKENSYVYWKNQSFSS